MKMTTTPLTVPNGPEASSDPAISSRGFTREELEAIALRASKNITLSRLLQNYKLL